MKSKRAREAVEAEEKDPQVDVPAKKRKRGEEPETDAGLGFVVDVKKPKKEDSDKKEKKEKKDRKDKKKDKKKDQKESRKEKKDKRKDLLDLPEEEDEVVDEPAAKEDAVVEEATAKTNGVDAEEKSKKKKEKKEKKKAAKAAAAEAPATEAAPTTTTTTNGEEKPATSDDAIDLDASTGTKADRHIVFVGNLPFTATAATISAHFASLSPIAVRCLKDRGEDAKPCRGIAFVEFGKVWHQRTCLDKFHHSEFNDGISPARKINVELTAGGGGKTKQRQEKIKAKNVKLDENRAKRIEKEKNPKPAAAANDKKPAAQNDSFQDSIHPSRRGRVPGMGM